MYNYLPLVLILSITPAIALAQISLDDWKVDIRYIYDSQSSTVTKKQYLQIYTLIATYLTALKLKVSLHFLK